MLNYILHRDNLFDGDAIYMLNSNFEMIQAKKKEFNLVIAVFLVVGVILSRSVTNMQSCEICGEKVNVIQSM